ncbi:SDR family oxidoreductase [Saccharicrinis sp. FJH54]|uniref:SDR family oxidoreductase n=1 Tax=Saccharicrinis sp. FJH54 TaxID=3344665 RepID=UPI0035D4D8ED
MKVFVTGATGFIGKQLVTRLVEEGHSVHALYRTPEKKTEIDMPGVLLFQGDILDQESLEKAMAGCDVVFHLAAFAKLWDKDTESWYRINVTGTENVLDAAHKAGIRRFILTSTAGKYGPSTDGIVTEATKRTVPYLTEYEETKDMSEQRALTYPGRPFDVVIVNPTRVYGPGLLSESNGVTRMVDMYVNGRYNVIPGDGESVGNYVYIDDVVEGHILALKKGKDSENYLLAGENASFNEFFKILGEVSGVQKRMLHLPTGIMSFVATLFEAWTKVSGRPPLITKKWLKRFMYNWNVSCEKAEKELQYKPVNLEFGLINTVKWLKHIKNS